MRSWKKRLNDEFNASAPALSEKFKNAPIMSVEKNNTTVKNGNTQIKRRIGLSTFCAAMATVIVFAFLGIFGVFDPKNNPIIDNYIFTLEINPAVVFVTDKDGKVESVKALNEDADLILADETELNKIKNKPLKEAIVIYTDSAAQLGFLDFSTNGDAVRLSSTNETDNNIFAEVSNSLSSYFCEKGIYAVVVENKLSVQEMCLRVGLTNSNSIANLTSAINNLSICYGNRISENANLQEISKLYNSYIVGNGLLEIVQKELLDNVPNIIQNAQMLSNIASINMQIMAKAYTDYWHIKNQSVSQELEELVNSMETVLAEYENKFNKSINSLDELLSAINVYSSYSGQDLEDVVNSLSAEQFTLEATNFVGMLENIGNDVSQFVTLLTEPQSASEYFEKFDLIVSLLQDTRFNQYFEIYNEVREKISENDYANFVAGIENEYGSLENFWNNHKK
ncbi:MAG: hypothetical protein ACI4R8_03655 [Candidatus Caccovivens sp.]